jgi:hypothetical protein
MCQHFRVPWPYPHINEQENGANYNFANNYDKLINNAQNNFFFKDKGKEMRLQIHGLIEKKKKQINIINRYTMKNELTLIYNLSAAYFIASTKSLMASAKLFVDEANVSWLFIRPTGLKLSCSDT